MHGKQINSRVKLLLHMYNKQGATHNYSPTHHALMAYLGSANL